MEIMFAPRSPAGLGQRLAAAWARVRAASGDGWVCVLCQTALGRRCLVSPIIRSFVRSFLLCCGHGQLHTERGHSEGAAEAAAEGLVRVRARVRVGVRVG